MAETLAALIEEYLIVLKLSELSENTIKNKRSALKLFREWAEENDLASDVSKLKGKHLRAYFLHRQEQGTGKGIRRSNHTHLQIFFDWVIAEYKKELQNNPMDKVEKPTYRPPVMQFPEVEIIDKMIGTCDNTFDGLRDRLLLLLYKQTGARASEIVKLELPDIDDIEQLVTIRFGKGGKERQAPFRDETAIALVYYLQARESHMYAHLPQLFLGRKGAFGYNGVRNMFTNRSLMVSDTRIKPHGLRHAFVHEAKQRGVSDEALLEILGWSTRSMLDYYARALRKERALTEYREKMR